MKKNQINSQESRNVQSDIVKKIVNSNSKVNANVGTNVVSIADNHNIKSKNNIGNIIILSSIIAIIVILMVLIFSENKKDITDDTVRDKTIFEEAYESIGFEEDLSMKKLSCTRKIPHDNSEIQEQETLIYYFSEDDIEISVYHTNISLSDEYMDYYDKIYNEYVTSLKNDYNYENVDTNIIRRNNQMLVTIITYAKKGENKKLGIQPYLNYEDAKMSTMSNGYICD